MPTVVIYASGHGFGHASRQVEVINTLTRRRPELNVWLRSTAPPSLLAHTLHRRDLSVVRGAFDTGIVQLDSLHLDAAASIDHAAAFYATLETRAAREADWLRAIGASLVIADTPPLACLAARQLPVPAFVVGNFTWDWIYAAYTQHLAAAPRLVSTLAAAYATADAGWRLPMWGGFESIETVVDVPFIARHARHDRTDVRRACGLPLDRPLALISFGGYDLAALTPAKLDLGECVLVTTGLPSPGPAVGVRSVDEAWLYASGYRYEDLVGAVDIVLTKPGYGIISECIANETAIVYTSRGTFAEYGRLVDQMPRWVACEFIGHDDLFAGRWANSFERVLAKPWPSRRPRTDGADVIVERLLDRLPARR